MKREKIIEKPLFVIGVICCAILWSFLRPSPIEKMDFEGCTVAACHGENEAHLTSEDTSEFVAVLKQAEIGMKLGDSHMELVGCGPSAWYKVYLENGEMVEISTPAERILINHCGYQCDEKTLDWLLACWEKYTEQFVPKTTS